MTLTGETRRKFIGGAVAGVAVVGAAAWHWRGAAGLSGRDGGIDVVPGSLPAIKDVSATPDEARRLSGVTVGQSIQFSGPEGLSAGTLSAVLVSDGGGRARPAGLRAEPFWSYFHFDLYGAPAGNRIYRLSAPVGGLTEVFLTRGADVGGKAVLAALFN